MLNAWGWNPSRENPGYPGPRHASSLTAAQKEPPQSSQTLPEDTTKLRNCCDCGKRAT
jgi:hypothetical protein